MEYIYAAMLIHKAGGKIDEASVKRVVEATGVKANDAKVKAKKLKAKAKTGKNVANGNTNGTTNVTTDDATSEVIVDVTAPDNTLTITP